MRKVHRLMKVHIHKRHILFALFLSLTAFHLPAFGEDRYDRYTQILRPSSQPSAAKNIASHFLVYPFEIVRWPTDRALVWLERERIVKKSQWIYDEMVEKGITPNIHITSFGSAGAGADFDLIRIVRQKERFPDSTLKGWVNWTRDVIFETGARFGFERIADTGFRAFENVKYENRPQEHFYGIGPHTSAGDGTSFRMEATTLESKIGYSENPSFSADVKFAYQNVNITNGEDGGRGIIDEIFPSRTIPGLDGDELITVGFEWSRDTRNRKENSIRGGNGRFGFSFNEGVGNSDARYVKFEGEGSRFLRLGSDRRVLALHFYAEHNQEAKGHEVPFHQMAKLGDYGSYPRLSHTLRSYDFNRFFDESAALLNIEYRYTIYEYKDVKMDSVFFLDEGQVFDDLDEFIFRDFRESYGVGVRVSIADHVVFSIEMAHGDEGTRFYAKTGAPF